MAVLRRILLQTRPILRYNRSTLPERLQTDTRQRDFSSPHDLIIHESLRSMIAEVAGLRERCEQLETVNAELAISVRMLEQAYSDNLVRAPLTKANLTGYAFSDVASTGTQSASNNSNNSVEQKFVTVGEILNNHEQQLRSFAAYLEKQGQCIAELTVYKQSTEVLFRALRDELSGLDISEHDKKKPQITNSDATADMLDKHVKLEERLTMLEMKGGEMGGCVDSFANLPNQVQQLRERQVYLPEVATSLPAH